VIGQADRREGGGVRREGYLVSPTMCHNCDDAIWRRHSLLVETERGSGCERQQALDESHIPYHFLLEGDEAAEHNDRLSQQLISAVESKYVDSIEPIHWR
jgi:hypothetical protein